MALDVGTEDTSIVVQVVGGIGLPFADPRDPNRPMVVPSTQVNFGLNKKAAEHLIKLLQENVDNLPDEKPASGLIQASSLADADRLAEAQKKLT